MTSTIVNLALIFALRNRGIHNVQIIDTVEYDNSLQVWFLDENRRTMVLTDEITCEEAQGILANLPARRRKMMCRAYSL